MQNKDAQHHTDKAKDAMHTATDAAKDAASQVGQAVSSAAGTVGRKAEDWTAAAGQKVENLADTLRHSGPDKGMLGKANEALAEGIERTGEYLHEKRLSGMMDDMTDLIKRNPIPALLVGLGIGYLLGKSLRS